LTIDNVQLIENDVKESKIMQAYEGYLENGQFFPFGTQKQIPGIQHVVVTVLGEGQEELKRRAAMKLFSELEKGRASGEKNGWLSEEEADVLIDSL
jgi:hypothetical protein